MKWFEPILIILAVAMVVVPFAVNIYKAFTKKGNCSCGCSCCDKKDKCLANFKSYIKKNEKDKMTSSSK